MCDLLAQLHYSLQSTRKTREGSQHPGRDAQFRHIAATVAQYQSAGQPVISVDTKKKEQIGDFKNGFKNGGREYQPRGKPEQVRTHDFIDPELGKVAPYGVFDLTANVGWVNVGIDHDTAEFAVQSIRRWWLEMGQPLYVGAQRLLIKDERRNLYQDAAGYSMLSLLSTFHKRLIVSVGGVILVAAGLSADRTNVFSSNDKAFYADQATLDFVRPGLVVKITKAEIAADGTTTAWVKIADPKGAGLDRLGLKTAGTISLSFLNTYIPAGQDAYVSYITRVRTSGANTVTQATGENTGTWTELAPGEYSYKFLNKAPATIDRSATHTIGAYGSRNLS